MNIKLRYVSLFFLLSLVPILLSGNQTHNSDDLSVADADLYSLAFVHSAMDYFSPGGGGWEAESKRYTNLKPSLPQMGDAVSIAVLKIYDLDKLIRPVNAEAYLTVVRNSFVNRSRVLEESNRRPRVTSLVLLYLEEKETEDAGLRKRIAYVKGCIKEFTCSSQGEAEFFGKH